MELLCENSQQPKYINSFHNHMMYGSWDMECNRQNFLSFWTISCPFTLLSVQKIKMKQKMEKKPGDIIILLQCAKIHDHMLYYSLDMACDGCN